MCKLDWNSICCLVFLCITDIFFFSSLISEAVTGVVGRADIGACLFFIASLLAYIKSHELSTNVSLLGWSNTKWRWLIFCFLLCIASMLTKEHGITVLGACAVYEVMILISSNRKQNLTVALTQASVSSLNRQARFVFFYHSIIA